jgi:hypothetical protein
MTLHVSLAVMSACAGADAGEMLFKLGRCGSLGRSLAGLVLSGPLADTHQPRVDMRSKGRRKNTEGVQTH